MPDVHLGKGSAMGSVVLALGAIIGGRCRYRCGMMAAVLGERGRLARTGCGQDDRNLKLSSPS
jgi:RNA-splicing ligase RtcB